MELFPEKVNGFQPLTLLRMGYCGAAHEWGGEAPLPKICHIYPATMKLDTIIPYLKKIQKIYESRDVTHTLSSADISIFSEEISKFCHIKKYRYRLHIDTSFQVLLSYFESLKTFLIIMVAILMMPAKMATLGLLKIKHFEIKIMIHNVLSSRHQPNFIT